MNSEPPFDPEQPYEPEQPAELPPHHAPSQKRRLAFWAKILASKFLFVSILVHVLFGAGATLYVVQRYQNDRKRTFQGGPPSVNPRDRKSVV